MPSHGSLQQAVKVRPERGEKEGKEAEKKNFFQTRYRRRLRNIMSSFFLCLHLISINSTTKEQHIWSVSQLVYRSPPVSFLVQNACTLYDTICQAYPRNVTLKSRKTVCIFQPARNLRFAFHSLLLKNNDAVFACT